MSSSNAQHSRFPRWLLRSKLLPQKQLISLLPRKELLRRLSEGLERKITVISAPAGYGKSTLAASWRKELRERGILVPWLTLDNDDNEFGIFVTYLAYAFHTGGFSEELDALAPDGFNMSQSPRQVIGLICSMLTASSRRAVLILDDFEKLSSRICRELIDPFIAYMPENLHLVVLCRGHPTLSLNHLRLQGQLNEIDARDLKFTLFEIQEFLPKGFSRQHLQRITERSEGWPVALQVLRHTLHQNRDYEAVMEKFCHSSEMTDDYFSEQFFSGLPEETRDFLLDVSILDRIDAKTADYIRNRQDSARFLDELGEQETFIVPLETEDPSFRLHPLLRDFLMAKLSVYYAERKHELHTRMADFEVAQGHLIRAMRHALAAHDAQRAGHILERAGGILLWNREGMTRLRRAHELLPDHVVNSRPRLQLVRALIYLKSGQINVGRDIYHHVRAATEFERLHDPQLDYDLALIAATLAVYEGTPLDDQICRILMEPTGHIQQDNQTQLGFAHTFLCVQHLQKGHFAEVEKTGRKAIALFRQVKSIFGEAYIYFHLGVAAMAAGQPDQAMTHYHRAQDMARRHFIDDPEMKLIANILMAECLYEQNDIPASHRLLTDVVRRLEKHEAWYEIYAAGYITAANITFLKEGLEPALTLLDQAQDYIQRERLTLLNRLVISQKVHLLTLAGNPAKARRTLQKAGLSLEDYTQSNTSIRETCHVVQAIGRLLLSEERYDDVLRELPAFRDRFHRCGYPYAALKFDIFLAVALYKTGAMAKAFEQCRALFATLRTHRLVRVFLDEAVLVRDLLTAYIAHSDAQEKDHAAYLLDLLEPQEISDISISLSKREKQVLVLLAEGHPDKVIARQLGVSENTVRFHLKNLYGKLRAQNRLQAVNEARRQSLL
tara:strand:- start:43 stop:2730 length:2688 start_codon:yes stop_codon:yes gene_type:complete